MRRVRRLRRLNRVAGGGSDRIPPMSARAAQPLPFKMRLGLWLLAWLAVGIPTAYAVLGDWPGVLFLPLFPQGLAYFIDPRLKNAFLFLGWIVYIALTIVLLRTRSWLGYLALYILFCGLLIVNGVGCARMSRSIKLTGITPLPATVDSSPRFRRSAAK